MGYNRYYISLKQIVKNRGDFEMYISQVKIKNFRLLKDVTIDFDKSLTLFVGKNNTGKTSIINIMELLLSEKKDLPFEDYPLDCRKTLYEAVKEYWGSTDDNPVLAFQNVVPTMSIKIKIDYSDNAESYGALSNFIIDLDDECNSVLISVSFDIPLNVEETLAKCKEKYDTLMSSSEHSDENLCVASVVKDLFSDFFEMNIATVNPGNPEDIMLCSKTDLKRLFCMRIIKAERNLDESDSAIDNPLGQIMKKLFNSEIGEVETELRPAIEGLQGIVSDVNFNVQNRISSHMDKIVAAMTPFGYPDGEDLELRANTTIALEKRIIDATELAYVSADIAESLPGSHNGLGYKNLIKISMELHDYARTIKADRTKIPLLFIEEPEAHMHPQLQVTFVEFLVDFLKKEVGNDIVQSVITTHSPHIANTVPFTNVRYIRRFKNHVVYKNLGDFIASGVNEKEKKQHMDFLQKYMKLSYCDLYFCDKAIVVKGASERLLIPDMIRKCEESGVFGSMTLSSQYYTIVEIGGAYAHLFYDFVDYIGVPTLIITDIDFVDVSGKVCQETSAKRSSNAAIQKWCHDVFQIAETAPILIEKVLELARDEDKRENGLRRIEFQKKEGIFHPRSFEEAIINVNRELFGKSSDEILNFTEEDTKKTDFAVSLLYDPKYSKYEIPSYIKDGLIWLCSVSRFAKGEEPVIMHRRQYRGREG